MASRGNITLGKQIKERAKKRADSKRPNKKNTSRKFIVKGGNDTDKAIALISLMAKERSSKKSKASRRKKES